MDEKEKEETKAPVEGETPKKSQRETFMDRYKTDYPDDNFEDEEAMFGRMNERNAEFDRMRGREDDMKRFVHDHPQFGGMYLDAAQGKNFIESFLSRFSKDDILAAYDDPEMAKKLADAQAEFLKSQEDSKKLKEEGEANIQESIKRLNDYCEANGIDEEEATKIWGECIDFYVNGLKGIFTEEVFDMVYKAKNHDADVEAARAEGEQAGRNAKIKTQLASGKGPEGLPPTFDGGQGAAAPEAKPKQKKRFYNPFSNEWEESEG